MAYFTVSMRSNHLKGNETVGIIMPDKPRKIEPKAFYRREKKYKVLWLLHGGMGDYSDWVRKSNIELYACENDLVVVMPSAMNSQYSNWDNYATGYDMYRFLLEELMPMVYGWLPVSDKREDNFVAGLSMGGGGALKYALNEPKRFSGAAILSWAPYEIPSDPAFEEPVSPWVKNWVAAQGGLEKLAGSRDDTWYLTQKLAGTDLPKLYFSIGEDDDIYPRFCRYRQAAERSGLDAQFRSVAGYSHEWRFWDMEIQNVLQYFGLSGGKCGNAF